MNPTNVPSNPVVDRPLDNFTDCHKGIIAHLDAFSELPALAGNLALAGPLAKDTQAFFQGAVIDHHHEEEKDLFPAVLAASSLGAEYDEVQRIVNQLTAEHREIEAIWRGLEPAVSQLADGKPANIGAVGVASLVQKYHAHARFEEETFLPLSALILGRRDGKMASLGLALHMRHVLRAAKRGLRGS